MKRRPKAVGKAGKAGRRKASNRQNELKARNRDETLEQLAATSEILEAIGHSTFDLQTVLATLVKSAGRLCQAENVQIFLSDGEFYRLAADNGFSPAYQQYARDHPIRPGRDTLVARTAFRIEPVQIPDALADPEYTYGGQKLGGYRTLLGVPLLRDKKCIGVIALTRSKVHPFTDRQIALVTNFAAQAVIAIENARLLDELRQRTTDLTESLEQQTATSEVLKVISSSPGDLEPVFKAILENAVRICGARFGNLALFDRNEMRIITTHNAPPALEEFRRIRPVIDLKTSISGPLVRAKRAVHVPDLAAEEPYARSALAKIGGARTALAIPMLREDILIGQVSIYRLEVLPFTEKQIALVQNFAAQAVIAVENARLLNELRQRTIDLTEALEQQTATSDVLKVISTSSGDLIPVFEAMLRNALQICEAKFGNLWLREGQKFRIVADLGGPAAYHDEMLAEPLVTPDPRSAMGQVADTGKVVQIDDISKAPTHGMKIRIATIEIAKGRTLIAVPMLKNRGVVGIIAIYKQEVRPFTDKQIELLQNFAAQAVIAIENARLLNELRQRTADLTESLEQQTATSEVLRVISSSPGELAPVFNSILVNAKRICEAKFAHLLLYDGKLFHAAALEGASDAFVEFWRRGPHALDPRTGPRQAVATKQVVHIPDIQQTERYQKGDPQLAALADLAHARSVLIVPMLKDDRVIGTLSIYREVPVSFSEKQIELVNNFSRQAVIAIENTRLLNELRESLDQQMATSDVLRVISSSPGELEPVFQAMLANAVRICDSQFGVLFRYEKDYFVPVAQFGLPPALAEFDRTRGPFQPNSGTILDRVVQEKKAVHLADDAAELHPSAAARLGGARSIVSVPMFKEDALVGAINIYRQEVRPFTKKQVDLVDNFAAQAVIAIENARLLNELRESLEQQTATSDVLSVISSSPGELEPVFTAVLENATRICEAKFGVLALKDGDAFRFVTMHNAPPAYIELRQREPLIRPTPNSAMERALATRQAAQIADITEHPVTLEDPNRRSFAALTGARTLIVVPMLKDDDIVGLFIIYRQEVRPFTDKQIELLTNFAAQAVIAIENTRLLNELRQSLEQQTATSDVLRVISSSPGQLKPVFNAMLENATRICEAESGFLWIAEDDGYRVVALHGAPPAVATHLTREPIIHPHPRSPLPRVAATRQVLHIADLAEDPAYKDRDPAVINFVELAEARTVLLVPLLQEGGFIGAVSLYRKKIQPFTEKQIALVQNFAAQAVIAIENARLLNELRESLQQQTATADVLKVISRSTFNLQTVLNTLTESAVRLCGAERANIWRPSGEVYKVAATFALSPEHEEVLRRLAIRPGRDTITGRTLLEGKTVHIPDVLADPEYNSPVLSVGTNRTVLGVPLMREGVPVGVLVVTRSTVRPFSSKEIELVETFANQAVIAIENVRLFEAEQRRTNELAKSLEDLRTAQDRLVQTQKLASLGQLTAGIAHEIKNPLNFVNNFSGVSIELIDELQETLKRVTADGKTRVEIGELGSTLRNNLDKIVQHGRRADAIVKNMLLHSREDSGEHRPVDINALVEESLNLAYHGARAETQGFNITLERSFDSTAGEADVYPQEISRVLINLISNGFYATTKRHAQAESDGYEPILRAATKDLGDRVEIRIRDNGIGIPPEVREKMFNPFFTTKPAGEGTGLGLSISHDIIVKQHSGSIEVDTEPGEFTEFRIILPRAAA